MKKILMSLIIAMSLFSVISCNPDKSSSDTYDNSSSDTYDIPFPVFGDAGSAPTRGLMEMPIAYFEGDQGLACAVMTVMPTMTNLEAQQIELSMSAFGKIEAIYTVFGFTMRLEKDYSRINKDGVYLQYSIWNNKNDETAVGFCDYYYSIKNKTFSYRQSVACSFELPISDTIKVQDNEVLNLEYIDVPIENPLVPVFSVGQLTEEGVLDDNAFVDQFSFREWESGPHKWVFERGYITAKEVNEDGYYTLYSMKQPDHYLITDYKDYENDLNDLVCSKIYDSDKKIIRENININFMLELYPFIYENGESIAAHHSQVKGYESYEEFKEDSFSSLKEMVKSASEASVNNTIVKPNTPRPTIYTYKGTESIGASTWRDSTSTNNTKDLFSELYGSDSDKNNDENYKNLGFNKYLGEYSEDEESDIREFAIRRFLEKCGIKNESYIESFIEKETYCEDNKQKLTERIKASD